MKARLFAIVACLSTAALAGRDDLGCAHCREARAWLAFSSPVDPETGRSTLNYPPHRFADHQHMRLDLTIRDMNLPRIDAVQSLSFAPIARPLDSLRLDARFLTIQSVEMEGHSATFTHDGLSLRVTFDPPIPPGERRTLVTRYRITDPRYGLLWTLASPDWPGRPPQIHTQGQPETNSYWFPCHDSPNEKLTTEIVATVPRGFLVSSNGKLVERRAGRFAGSDEASDTFHWLQDTPHVNYLVSLVVGKFDVVDVGTGRLPMNVYVPPGRASDVKPTYGRTARMTTLFERLFDEPYPWRQYSQLVVWNFGWGGMENTSATTMYDTAILAPSALIEHDLDGLISHELAHQWFGDLITCKSWEHIWLNEGFATYLTSLWFEERDGRDAYLAGIQGNFDSIVHNDRPEAPNTPALVSKMYRDPWDVFQKAANPYPKGASVLHMLRMRLGDEAFFRGTALFVDRHKHSTAETSDLRAALEAASGESLEQFFRQWCDRPGVPVLRITPGWDRSSGMLTVDVEQTQAIDADNPAFEFDLPVHFHSTGGSERAVAIVPVRGRKASASFRLGSAPAVVSFDPELTVLSRIEVVEDVSLTLARLAAGPTVPARIQACRSLADPGVGNASAVNAALSRVAWDRRGHRSLRIEAIKALARRDALGDAFAPLDDDPFVREATVDAITDQASRSQTLRTVVLPSLAAIAGYAPPDGTIRERCAAIRALGRLGATEHLGVVLAALEVDSQHDSVRQSALQALADLPGPESLRAAASRVSPASHSRTRSTAISTVARLAQADRDLAYTAIAPLLFDRDRRAWRAAGSALARLGDARGVNALQTYRDSTRDPADHAVVDRWLEELREELDSEP